MYFLGSFLKAEVQNVGFLIGCQNSKNFLGCLKFLFFFFGEMLMLGPSLRVRKKLE